MKKKTNKVLLGVIIACFLLTAVFLLLPLFFGTIVSQQEGKYINGGKQALDAAALKGVKKIRFSGEWEATVSCGQNAVAEVPVPSQGVIFNRGCAAINGDTLELEAPKTSRRGSGEKHPKARIVLPEIEYLQIDGASSLRLDGFSATNLKTEINGAADLIAKSMKIGQLSLVCRGAANAEFLDSEIVNADIDLLGASNVVLMKMAGGVLSGNITGFSNVEYRGSVSANTLSCFGISNIEKGR